MLYFYVSISFGGGEGGYIATSANMKIRNVREPALVLAICR
jgi:hypothetical protein